MITKGNWVWLAVPCAQNEFMRLRRQARKGRRRHLHVIERFRMKTRRTMNLKDLRIAVVQLDGSESVLVLIQSGFCVGVFIFIFKVASMCRCSFVNSSILNVIPTNIQLFHTVLSYDL